jgi:carbamoyl-phosphate synthase large subunit
MYNESIVTDKKKIIVLAQGQIELGKELNLIIHARSFAARVWYEIIMINCNPETVSTDFDDKLYFEPVFWEHIYDIIQHENQKV